MFRLVNVLYVCVYVQEETKRVAPFPIHTHINLQTQEHIVW